MCGGEGIKAYETTAEAARQQKPQWQEEPVSPEKVIATALRRELGVIINEQALRIFIRKEWKLLAKAAHEIHGS